MTQRWKQARLAVAAFFVLGLALAAILPRAIVTDANAADAPKARKAAAAKPDAPKPDAAAKSDSAADEKAIRATADAFVAAFDAGDAKAIGALFTPDAQYTDEDGQEFRGRAEIEQEYAGVFKSNRGATMTVIIESIRMLGTNVAIEKGVAKVKPAKGEATASRYTVVHVKRDGNWLMAVGHDAPYVDVANGEYLKDLEWLIGDWAPRSKNQPLHIKFDWLAQKNFIRNTFRITKDDEQSLTGGQIIGWNPKLGKIVSWHFDAQGGFGNDVWTKDGEKWVIEASGTFRDGSESSSVNILTPIDANTFTWQSIDRKLEGVSIPDTDPVTIVRVESGK
jgi:uncharacterized protein (TIGR02246 family)